MIYETWARIECWSCVLVWSQGGISSIEKYLLVKQAAKGLIPAIYVDFYFRVYQETWCMAN